MLFALSTRYWMYSLNRYANALRLTVGTCTRVWAQGRLATMFMGRSGHFAMSTLFDKLTSALFFVNGRSTMGKVWTALRCIPPCAVF